MRLNTFSIKDVMIHDVPRGNDLEEELILTDDPITLDVDLRRYFQRKIIASLEERGVEVASDPNEDDTVRKAAALIVAHPSDLAAASRTIAERLHEVQTGRNPPGLLAVACGTVDGKPCASVLKLEREQGLRFRINTVNHRRVVDLEFLRDLTLTDKTKVFKTSLFVAGGKTKVTAGNVSGRVSDDQRGSDKAAGVATFFLTTFLGCRLRESPEKTTLAFVSATDAFINEEVTNPERRGKYQVALLASMQSQSAEVRPRTFANTNLDPIDRPKYLDRIRSAGVNPDVSFRKDARLVKVSGFKMTFESGMVLVGRKEDLEERVDIQPEGSATPGVIVNDVMKTLSGR